MKPILKLYRGYANEQELMVMGHIIRPTAKKDYDFQKRHLRNARSMIRLFQVSAVPNADVYLHLGGKKIHTRTLDDGYFKFCVPATAHTPYGWSDYTVSLVHEGEEIAEKGSLFYPNPGKLGFISDIDDTFLVSHTRNPLKKLYILLFRNVNTRKVFEGVVEHYRALSTAGRNSPSEENAFFYVSSSEWNLYGYINRFIEINELPRAVLLLKDIATGLGNLFLTGRGNHNHKFEKIKHILEFYPKLHYTLLGDDAQADPFLYEDICKIFPVNVKAVYIRQTGSQKKQKTIKALKNMEALGVAVCYFRESSEAIAHSREIGLIS